MKGETTRSENYQDSVQEELAIPKFCPACYQKGLATQLKLYQVNLHQAVYLCPNYLTCLYPKGNKWLFIDRSIDKICGGSEEHLTSVSLKPSDDNHCKDTPTIKWGDITISSISNQTESVVNSFNQQNVLNTIVKTLSLHGNTKSLTTSELEQVATEMLEKLQKLGDRVSESIKNTILRLSAGGQTPDSYADDTSCTDEVPSETSQITDFALDLIPETGSIGTQLTQYEYFTEPQSVHTIEIDQVVSMKRSSGSGRNHKSYHILKSSSMKKTTQDEDYVTAKCKIDKLLDDQFKRFREMDQSVDFSSNASDPKSPGCSQNQMESIRSSNTSTSAFHCSSKKITQSCPCCQTKSTETKSSQTNTKNSTQTTRSKRPSRTDESTSINWSGSATFLNGSRISKASAEIRPQIPKVTFPRPKKKLKQRPVSCGKTYTKLSGSAPLTAKEVHWETQSNPKKKVMNVQDAIRKRLISPERAGKNSLNSKIEILEFQSMKPAGNRVGPEIDYSRFKPKPDPVKIKKKMSRSRPKKVDDVIYKLDQVQAKVDTGVHKAPKGVVIEKETQTQSTLKPDVTYILLNTKDLVSSTSFHNIEGLSMSSCTPQSRGDYVPLITGPVSAPASLGQGFINRGLNPDGKFFKMVREVQSHMESLCPRLTLNLSNMDTADSKVVHPQRINTYTDVSGYSTELSSFGTFNSVISGNTK